MTPDQGVTSGSQSHPTNFNHGNLAQAGATAREALLQLASKRLECARRISLPPPMATISVKGDASKKVSYGELVGGKKFNLKVDSKRHAQARQRMDRARETVARPDLPAMVTGQFEFVHNVRAARHAARQGGPAARRRRNADQRGRKLGPGMPGLVKVVVKKNFVGVVAEKPWQAMQAAQSLKVTWTPGPACRSTRTSTTSAEPEADARHAAGQLEGCRPEAGAERPRW